MKGLIQLALCSVMLVLAAPAFAQSVEPSVRSRQIYADVPFELQVIANGFEDSPKPTISEFEIAGASVVFQGVSPSVMTRMSVINGRRTNSRVVKFVYSYRVEARGAGTFEIPAITVEQDGVNATSTPRRFEARGVANTKQMRIEMQVPERPVWIGESFEVKVRWYLTLNPRDQVFVVPLFDHPAFEVEAPEGVHREALEFQARGADILLPYQSSKELLGGTNYTLFEFTGVATPLEAGSFELDAPRVVAKLQVGQGRDSFGFRSARYERFKATGKATNFEVKPLPISDRPASFSNAVGTGFSIQVTTSRSVVSVGEPIELSILIRGKRGLEGISLPKMLGEGRLDDALFDVLDGGSVGEMGEDGLSKLFKVTAILKSAEAREIPPIEFAYFDPEIASYKTAKSQPIALNVGAASLVGASDVVTSTPKSDGSKAGARGRGAQAFAGNLSPSAPSQTLRSMLSLGAIVPVVWGLYLVPLLLFAFVLWRSRTGNRRGRTSELKVLHKKVESAASRAAQEAASGSAAALVNALREFARATGATPGAWLGDIESQAFDPKRSGEPVDPDLLDKARTEARCWLKASQSPNKASRAGATALVLLLVSLNSHAANAQSADSLNSARSAYEAALDTGKRGERTRAFALAQGLYRELVDQNPERPELLTDWGNAALGAGDYGLAVLAYRRALRLDRSLGRARDNLSWIRQQLPERLVDPSEASAIDSLFFWHRGWSLPIRHLVAAAAFAVALLLLLPLGLRYQTTLRRLAGIPMLLFVATLGSALMEPDTSSDAVVVIDGETLYSADSLGAPPAMSTPAPAGAEVRIKERRGAWTRVAFSDGTTGWMNSGAVTLVSPSEAAN